MFHSPILTIVYCMSELAEIFQVDERRGPMCWVMLVYIIIVCIMYLFLNFQFSDLCKYFNFRTARSECKLRDPCSDGSAARDERSMPMS